MARQEFFLISLWLHDLGVCSTIVAHLGYAIIISSVGDCTVSVLGGLTNSWMMK